MKLSRRDLFRYTAAMGAVPILHRVGATPIANQRLPLDLPGFCVDIGPLQGAANSITDYSGMCYCPAVDAILMFGGGHAATPEDVVLRLPMDELTWRADYPATPLATMQMVTTTQYVLDGVPQYWDPPANTRPVYTYVYLSEPGHFWTVPGQTPPIRPVSRHTYTAWRWSTAVNRMVLMERNNGESNGFSKQTMGGNPAEYDPVTKNWIEVSSGDAGLGDAAVCEDPVTGYMLAYKSTGWFVYDPRTRTRVKNGGAGICPGAQYSENMIYYPPLDKFYYFGRFQLWDTALNSFVYPVFGFRFNRTTLLPEFENPIAGKVAGNRITTNWLPTGDVGSASETGFAYDSNSQIIVGLMGTGRVLGFKPNGDGTGTWYQHPAPGAYPNKFHCWAYAPTINAHFGICDTPAAKAQTYAFRWDPAQAVVCVDPSLPPSGFSTQQTYGQVIPQGETLPSGQVIVRNRWPDGTPKFALVTPGTPSGSNVTHGTTIVVSFGSYGSATLTTPVETTALGSLMSSFLYRGQIGSDPQLMAYAEIRKYKDGTITPMVWIENCFTYKTPGPGLREAPCTVTINGMKVFDWPWLSCKQRTRTVLVVPPAIGGDWTKIVEAHQAPPYGWHSPTVDPKFRTYVPGGRGHLPSDMSATGYAAHIGILPQWDAMYCASGTQLKAVLDQAMAGGCYSLHYRDETTNKPILPSQHPNIWFQSGDPNVPPAGSGGTNASPNVAHHPEVGFIAYLATGWRFFQEEQQFWALWTWGFGSYITVQRNGFSGNMVGQVRGQAWEVRTRAVAAAVSDDADQFRADMLNLLEGGLAQKRAACVDGTTYGGVWKNNIGSLGHYPGAGGTDPYGEGKPSDGYWDDAPWMQHFFEQALGYVTELGLPLSTQGQADLIAVRDFSYKHVVGMVGNGRPGRMCCNYTVGYGLDNQPGSGHPSPFYASWADEWASAAARHGIALPFDDSASLPFLNSDGVTAVQDYQTIPTGYMANLVPALAYAVRHGAPGANASWAWLRSSAAWVKNNEAFNNIPTFGIAPVAEGGDVAKLGIKPSNNQVPTSPRIRDNPRFGVGR